MRARGKGERARARRGVSPACPACLLAGGKALNLQGSFFIRCQASDKDSSQWVNTLTAAAEDSLSVKRSRDYSEKKDYGREGKKRRVNDNILSHYFSLFPITSTRQPIPYDFPANTEAVTDGGVV